MLNSDEIWILATASLVGISCALVGCFLVVRRLAMLGDAISHSVLFGIATAFLLSGSRSSPIMLLGAVLVGLLTAYLTSVLNTHGKLQEDASIGVTFTWLFALGVILISAFAGQVDLDQDCVLFGEIAFTPFDMVSLYGIEIAPRAFLLLLMVTLANIFLVTVGFRALTMTTFDPILAVSLGFKTQVWFYVLMTAVSLTTVASFESVGAILVVAMLVVPPNAAYLVARSMREMLLLSCLFSLAAVFSGYFLARIVDSSISASIGMMSGALLFTVILVRTILESPRKKARKAEEILKLSCQ